MMRLWVESYAKKTSVAPVGAMSFIVHAMLIAAWVEGTRPSESMPKDSFANRVYEPAAGSRAGSARVA